MSLISDIFLLQQETLLLKEIGHGFQTFTKFNRVCVVLEISQVSCMAGLEICTFRDNFNIYPNFQFL